MTKQRRFLVLSVAVLALAACDRMASQPKVKAFRPSPDAQALHRVPPPGTVAREDDNVPPPPVTLALLQRGQERFNIYCAPCHSPAGDGDGMIVRRGFPRPPDYASDRLMAAPPQHFVDVITNGYGVMYSYAARVAPADRWAIAAYIRALQESQHASYAALTPAEQAKLP
jgi:mono/diheme cytochrome c family protein